MLRESTELLQGNERFEGFVFDIIDEISKMLGFNYQFKLVDDSKYGALDKETGEWDGMIRELLEGVSSLKYLAFLFVLRHSTLISIRFL